VATLKKADQYFSELIEKYPGQSEEYGTYQRARVNNSLDPTMEQGLAKPYFEKIIELVSAHETLSNTDKQRLESAYRYLLGYYNSVAKDKEAGTAIAKVRIFQQEANEEFVLDVQFTEQADGTWRVTEVGNFHEFVLFITKARRAQLVQYADTTSEIISRHDTAMMQAQEQFNSLLSRGTLGSDETRKALKNFMENTIKADWQQRKAELEAVTVPASAQTLHKLRIKICDLHIAYAAGYAAWMTDKKATTIREADRQLKQAKTLEQEEKFLARRVGAPVEGEQ
jgi:hypothetical protein